MIYSKPMPRPKLVKAPLGWKKRLTWTENQLKLSFEILNFVQSLLLSADFTMWFIPKIEDDYQPVSLTFSHVLLEPSAQKYRRE